MNNTSYTSHSLFFTKSTYEKLNEFLKRADSSTKVLQNHINKELTQGDYCKVKVIKCNMIIIYYFNNNNIKLGHATFHLEPEKKNNRGKSYTFGRIHIQNNRNNQLRYVLKLDKTTSQLYNNSFQFSIGPGYIKDYFEECIKATIKILNLYFNLESNLSIEYKITSSYYYIDDNGKYIKSYWHKCFNSIKSQFSSSSASKNYLRRSTIKNPHSKSYSKTVKNIK